MFVVGCLLTDHSYEDTDVFHRIAHGDEGAFRQVFHQYGARIYPYILRIVKEEATARELVQEVFLKLWIARETLPSIDKPSAWLFRIASNLAITYFRRQELDKKILREMAHTSAKEVDTLDELTGKELKLLIHQAVQQLPAQRKRIYELTREQGLSRKEVAAQLGLSENTVRNQLGLALQTIQESIRNNSGYYLPLVLLLWK